MTHVNNGVRDVYFRGGISSAVLDRVSVSEGLLVAGAVGVSKAFVVFLGKGSMEIFELEKSNWFKKIALNDAMRTWAP